MRDAYGVETNADLAVAMNESPDTVKNWPARGVPLRHLMRAAQDTRASLDWLVFGQEPLPDSQIESAAVILGGDRSAALRLVAAEPHGGAWRKADVTIHTAGSLPQGGHPLKAGAQPVTSDAVLPVDDDSEVRPLVLSLQVQGAGRGLDYEVMPKVCDGAERHERQPGPRVQLDRAGELAMSYEWLRRNLGHTSGDLATVQVVGDSMSPTLLDGDTVIIDRGAREATVDAIYVVHMLGQRLVKRLQRKFDGSIVIISDNASYERELVPRDRVAEIEVVGRMVWPRVR